MNYAEDKSKLRRKIQLVTWIIVPITIFAGLKYPLIGWAVPVVMLMGIVGAFFRGRYVCGWLCPRGAFYDRVVKFISPKKKIPGLFRNKIFRWGIFVLLMGFMFYQISINPSDIYHWGRVFVRICIITTSIGVVLAIFYHPRTWCSFCPMGTMQGAIGGHKRKLRMDDGCKRCLTCEKECPIDLKIVDNVDSSGKLKSSDCLQCPECQRVCPQKILHF